MDPSGIPLFALADRRLAWLDQRQAMLAANIANADTPGFKPSDVTPFAQAVAQAGLAVTPVQTSPLHLPGTISPLAADSTRQPGEQAPDGNAVSLDEQLRRIADTDTAHQLVTGLYGKYLAMFRTAAGR